MLRDLTYSEFDLIRKKKDYQIFMAENQRLFALLIDGENISPRFVDQIMQKLREYGDPHISKVFHSKETLDQWEKIPREYDIVPTPVLNNIPQKNSVDIVLVVEAMSLLYEHPEITGFCIAASDSDYTSLARYLKSKNKFVLGMGEEKTPKTFRIACKDFVLLESPADVPLPVSEVQPPAAVGNGAATADEISNNDLLEFVIRAYQTLPKSSASNGAGYWVQLREIKEAMPELELPGSLRKLPMLAAKMKDLADLVPGIVEIREKADTKPTIHEVRIHEPGELDKLREAYEWVLNERNPKNSKDKWVTLAEIGSAQKKLYNKTDKNLKKVVEKYPNIFKLHNDGKRDLVRKGTK